MDMKIEFQAIGTIHTPYLPSLPIPNQPHRDAPGEFWISLNPEHTDGLDSLASFRYITVLFYLDKVSEQSLKINPPFAPELEVGVFASRTPRRPNPIGLSVVELKNIEGHEILISGIDVYNGTPLLDIKPYIKTLDSKADANDGWMDTLPDKEHRLAHFLGLEHEHGHEHDHSGDHAHGHSHDHAHDHSHDHDHKHSLDHDHKHNHKI
ncbi:putative methyltransferase, YaeB/AF_0241 family [Desulfitobacterium dichloroeliminans LMG P-21439]|uniref:Putative methyltransferase, YaeB/AF_0241 family n=2 Tax=Desulfitobacterium dichloroeliminans TaxID=233055 RepID=L0F6K1_DESDL|nr:putative methyltransferase, YaeB/AF_0241 family [Desulfitobacterium dichloroeliminans LMG P-21439]